MDLRGKQSNIFRLSRFDKEALVHVLFYRVLAPYSVIYGVILLASVFYGAMQPLAKAFTVVEWILFTPQLYESVKAFSLVSTRGLAHGHLNDSFLYVYRKRYGGSASFFAVLPYIALALWAIGFVLMIAWWTP